MQIIYFESQQRDKQKKSTKRRDIFFQLGSKNFSKKYIGNALKRAYFSAILAEKPNIMMC